MMKLSDREVYCLALIIANGGQIRHERLTDIIVEFKEIFHGLSERYIRYQLVRKILRGLVDKGNLSERPRDAFQIVHYADESIIRLYPTVMAKAIKNITAHRKRHVLEFDIKNVEDNILSGKWWDIVPFDLRNELREAIDIHQKTGVYDAVITKCGRCVEVMVEELNRDYLLFDPKEQITSMISRMKDEEVIRRFSDDTEDRETFRIFAYAAYTIYKFRSKMGAHPDWWWGKEEVASSCLILTFYIVDLYVTELRKG